jgi:hypothetical protein
MAKTKMQEGFWEIAAKFGKMIPEIGERTTYDRSSAILRRAAV